MWDITINACKSAACLYTNDRLSEKEIKERILFKIVSKKINLGINLMKKVKILYTENYDIDEKDWTRHK